MECQTAGALIRLGGDVVAKTQDLHYARKLYTKAEAASRYFPDFMNLADAVNRDLADGEWVRTIYTAQQDRCDDNLKYSHLADGILGNLNDRDWVKTILSDLAGRCTKETDFVRLARIVAAKLGDDVWVRDLLGKAEEKCADVSGYMTVAAALSGTVGDLEGVNSLYDKALTVCAERADFERLLAASSSASEEIYRQILAGAERKLSSLNDLVFVAENILTLLDDRQWAGTVYRKAQQASDAGARLPDLIQSIRNKLGDEGWARRLYQAF